MHTTRRTFLVLSLLLLVSLAALASGPVGIYAIVSKIVMEPNERAPERIQIWGTFTLVDGGIGSNGQTLTPKRGYLYFTLPTVESEREAALKEIADFKTVAGTGQAVAFGRFGYIGAFSDQLLSYKGSGGPPYLLAAGSANLNGSHAAALIHAESDKPAAPENYPLNMGLTKLSATGNLAAVVKQLEQAK